MVGITLSPEQIRSAPPQVRQWLEHEIAVTLGLGSKPEGAMEPRQLAACTVQEAATIYASIRGMLPAVNVFFELGREGASVDRDGVEAFRLVDMLRHTRLPGMEQLGECLQLIDQSFRQIRHDPDMALLGLDPRGYCLVATKTQRSILAVRTQLIAAQRIGQPQTIASSDGGGTDVDPSTPFTTSGTVPPSAIHLDGAYPGSQGSDGAVLSDDRGPE